MAFLVAFCWYVFLSNNGAKRIYKSKGLFSLSDIHFGRDNERIFLERYKGAHSIIVEEKKAFDKRQEL